MADFMEEPREESIHFALAFQLYNTKAREPIGSWAYMAPESVMATHHFQFCHSEEERRGIYSQFGAKNACS